VLNEAQDYPKEVNAIYESRRDTLMDGLERIGWHFARPRGTMFAWAPIPEPYKDMGSIDFAKLLVTDCDVALSVGIGFGLQAIVQNFVSGLILLIERPVKVGDWVVLGDAEGDIRRINVRATEIQMGDRSTVIVPNSELITKSVRNVTLSNAEGRVRIRLPVPVDTDAARVREIVGETFARHPGVLPSPKPSVLLDGIEGSSLIFIAVGYIANPRQAGNVRSELLFELLARLRDEKIALSSPQEMKLLNPTDAMATATPGAPPPAGPDDGALAT
jgi:small-conductance mechanosensitive channel